MKSALVIMLVFAITFYLDVGDAVNYEQLLGGVRQRKSTAENTIATLGEKDINAMEKRLAQMRSKLKAFIDPLLRKSMTKIENDVKVRKIPKEEGELRKNAALDALSLGAALIIQEFDLEANTQREFLSNFTSSIKSSNITEPLITLCNNIIDGTFSSSEMFKMTKTEFKTFKTKITSLEKDIKDTRMQCIARVAKILDELKESASTRIKIIEEKFLPIVQKRKRKIQKSKRKRKKKKQQP